jgi:threonine synthase
MRPLEQSIVSDVTETNPFIFYRERLDSYSRALAAGWSDQKFVDLVSGLNDQIQRVDGRGFSMTPTLDGGHLATALGLDIDLKVKVEIDSVGGSHKARHLFGVALHLAVEETASGSSNRPLAISSCGNAAIAAAIIAKAINHPIEVFVPTWAEEPVLEQLRDLGARLQICEPRVNEKGDPCYARFMEAVGKGSRPFGVQGVNTSTTFDGGRTLGWELQDQAEDLEAVFIQVGGGALGTATARALSDVAVYPVQVEGCAPFKRAWDLLAPDFDMGKATSTPERFMWPWDKPASVASGLLDDVTHDWLPLLEATLGSGGEPVVVSERTLIETHRVATSVTGLNVSPTGSAGLAGLVSASPEAEAVVGVLFTGIDRQTR